MLGLNSFEDLKTEISALNNEEARLLDYFFPRMNRTYRLHVAALLKDKYNCPGEKIVEYKIERVQFISAQRTNFHLL